MVGSEEELNRAGFNSADYGQDTETSEVEHDGDEFERDDDEDGYGPDLDDFDDEDAYDEAMSGLDTAPQQFGDDE